MENKSVLEYCVKTNDWGGINLSDNLVTDEMIREKLSQQFLESTKKDDGEYVGIEIELPIVNLNKEAVDFNVVHKVTTEFMENFKSFKVEGVDYDGNVYALKDDLTGDMLCYDCSYNNIEFAMGKEENIFKVNERFSKYYASVKSSFEKYDHTLTGMGINPYRKYNKEIPIPNERYLMLFNHLKSYTDYADNMMYFHEFPAYGMFSSASQVQLDVPYDDLIENINVFSKLEPIKALLFSNSVLLEDNEDYVCFRDFLWEYSTHGINPHNIGMYNFEFQSISELLSYLESLNIYCVMRDGFYINFPSMSLKEFFNSEQITGEFYCKGKFRSIDFEPSLDDIQYLRAFKFINLTFRGTLEYRSVCTQPVKDSMSVAAFHVGLKHKVKELEGLFDSSSVYHNGYNSDELRRLFIKRDIPSSIDIEDLYELAGNVLDLAYVGLKERGFGEEIFLKSLYDNIENRTNPGKRLLDSLEDGKSLEELINEYGELE